MIMKAVPILIMIICIAFVSCSDSSDPVNPDPGTMEPFETQTVQLAYGETVRIESASLTLKFDELLYDSRCPLGPPIYCFWEGQAGVAVLLNHPDRGSMVLTPAKRGGDTLHARQLSDVGLGYRIELVSIDPVPVGDNPPPSAEEYVIKLRVSTDDGTPLFPPVIGTTLSPDSLQIDDFQLDNLSLYGDILTIYLRYSGGCNLHTYNLFWTPDAFLESEPIQVNLYLSHSGYDDPCDAIIGDSPSFDITAIRNAYIETYGTPGRLQLNVYGYFEDEPGDRVSILFDID